MMLTLKGYRGVAAGLSTIEVAIYVIGLGIVMDNLDNYWNIVIYAMSFGLGVYVGMMIENKLALGYSVVETILPGDGMQLAKTLREEGFGVTIVEASGRDGLRHILEVLTPRKNERDLYQLIHEESPKAFVIAHEPKYVNGGFWTKRIRKSQIERKMG